MSESTNDRITVLLEAVRQGDESARGHLIDVAYAELRRVASGLMRKERSDHTLQTTALVNEAFVQLLGQQRLQTAQNRRHFFSIVTEAMRRVLVDHARKRHAMKRGGDRQRILLDEALEAFAEQKLDVIAVDEVLQQLSVLSSRQAQVIDLRFFGGFTMPEIAEMLDVSLSTAESDFRKASAFLRSRLQETSEK